MTQMPFGGLPMFLAPGGRGKPAKPGTTKPLQAGVRASSDNVGYLGPISALTEYTPGGAAPSGWAWDIDALVSSGVGSTLNLAYINGGQVVDDDGGATVTNCLIRCSSTATYGVTLNGTNKGRLTVEDTTVIGNLTGASYQVNGISSDDKLTARRCHVTQTGDGIHLVGDDSIVSQCYVGPLRYTDEEQHLDGMQVFQSEINGSYTIEHCYVAFTASAIGSPMNAALTQGPPTSGGPTLTPTLNNNYFEGGNYHLRLNFMIRDAVVTNNDIGPLHSGETGLISVEDVTYANWSNNRDSSGNLISQP